MKDEEFDALLKKHIQNDKHIPKKIDCLFDDFESRVDIKQKRKIKILNYLRIISIAFCAMLILFVGGCTYAHVNGIETLVSPILRKLGINSKYKENATHFNSEVTKQEVTIKLLDAAIDDISLIVGYEIKIANNNLDSWIDVNGEYKINDINVKPIATAIDKSSNNSYIYYQIFDTNELKIHNTENVK